MNTFMDIKTPDDFAAHVLNNTTLPVLAYITAEWCQPCRIYGPILRRVLEDYEGTLVGVRIDADEVPEIPARYSVVGVPTLLLFKDGEQKARDTGAMPEQNLREWLEQAIELRL